MKNVIGSLFLSVLAVPVCSFAELEVRVRPTAGGPQIHLNGRPVRPRFYFGVAHDHQTLKYCQEAGVNFISIAPPHGLCWTPPEQGEDWSAIDTAFDLTLRHHPKALIVPRVGINAPAWLLERHPEWKMQFRSGKDYGGVASVCAHDYRELAARQLEKLVRHLRAKYPDNFAGIHPVGQSYGEFFYLESLGGDLHGFETPVRDSWRRWLAARGEANAETAEIPTAEERLSRASGLLRDPARDRSVLLFSQFEQEELADFVVALAKAARRGSDGKLLVMFFHGYGFDHTTVPCGAAVTGDYGSEYMLTKAAGAIDIICSPFAYVNRRFLAPTVTQTAAESILQRGVMVLDEDDTRTHRVLGQTALERAGGWVRPAKEQTLRQLKSNLTSCIVRGRACWWMDLVGNGWYADRDLWRVMEELGPLDEKMLSRKAPYSPEIALLLDERSILFAAAGSSVVFQTLVSHARGNFELCGTPCGQYFATDALAGRVPARLQFFLTSFYADEATLSAAATQRTCQPHVTRVWCWAPGWISKEGKGETNICRLTGFAARRLPAAVPEVVATARGKALGFPETWKGEHVIDPLFAVEASAEETLARWPDGSPAIAVRRAAAGWEVFCGVPVFPVKAIGAFARLAGCRSYAEPGLSYVRAAEDEIWLLHVFCGAPPPQGDEPNVQNGCLNQPTFGFPA